MTATQIIVLGMHRSGTSAIAGLLAKTGMYFGEAEDAVPTFPCNEKGFWEREDVMTVNEHALTACGCKWDCVLDFAAEKIGGEALDAFRKQASDIISRLDKHAPWFVKDPRLCITFPLWRPLLRNPVCLLVQRNPLQVARSLRARHDCSTEVGLALWEQHVLSSLASSAGLPRLLIWYEDIIERPVESVLKLIDSLAALGVPGLKAPADDEVAQWLDRKLFHQRAGEEETREHLNAQQIRLYEALKDGSVLQWKAGVSLSPSSVEALEYHAIEDRKLRDQLAECRQARGYLKGREKHLVDVVRQFGAWSVDMEGCLDEMMNSLRWTIGDRTVAALTAITHKSKPTLPSDHLRRLLKASKELSETVLAPPPNPSDGDPQR